MSSPWELYDALLDAVPEDAVAEDVVVGGHWLVVRSGASTGMAMRYMEGKLEPEDARVYVGRPLREVAALVKSWNFGEAALGLAAVNAACNTPDNYRRLWGGEPKAEGRSVFLTARQAIAGKKVAVIGHFPDLPEKTHCDLSILERRPQPGDLPDSACEYVLPEQDFIFSTGTTLINKTLPRLLQLKGRSRFFLVGPSVPLHPLLYDRGVDVLAGVMATDGDKLVWNVRYGQCRQVFDGGTVMVELPREQLTRRP